MDNFKLESTYVSKIENGFLLTMSGYTMKEGSDRENYVDKKTYCSTLDEITSKLKEIYKDKE